MNSNSKIDTRVILFPAPTKNNRLIAAGKLNLFRIEQSNPNDPGEVLHLYGDNVLIPVEDTSGFRYGCYLYLTNASGSRAVPILALNSWSKPVIPDPRSQHPVWKEIKSGLIAAATLVSSSYYNLEGAVIAARGQLSDHETGKRGSRVLLGPARSLTFAASMSPEPPPAGSCAPFEFGMPKMKFPEGCLLDAA